MSLFLKWQVRRQRIAEQEEALKDCQHQTEQLQLWLADIAQTLEHVIRVNDQSQLHVISLGYLIGFLLVIYSDCYLVVHLCFK